MPEIDEAMGVNTPPLAGQAHPLDAIATFQIRMRSQARAHRGADVPSRPLENLYHRCPEGLIGNIVTNGIGAGDDQGVEPVLPQTTKIFVVRLDITLRLGAARVGIHGKGVHVDLSDPIARADQPQELALGCFERGVRHHVQQADV